VAWNVREGLPPEGPRLQQVPWADRQEVALSIEMERIETGISEGQQLQKMIKEGDSEWID